MTVLDKLDPDAPRTETTRNFEAPHVRGFFFSGFPLLLQHGIDHLHDEALLGFGQAGDAFELLLQLRRRAGLGGCGKGVRTINPRS